MTRLARVLVGLCALLAAASGFQHPLVPPPKTITDYCKFNASYINVACQFPRCSRPANLYHTPWGFTMRRMTLEYFNDVRDNVGFGNITPPWITTFNTITKYYDWSTEVRPASDMRVLSYDIELEFLAACYIHVYDSLTNAKAVSLTTEKWNNTRYMIAETTGAVTMEEILPLSMELWNDKNASWTIFPDNYTKWPANMGGYKDVYASLAFSKATHIGCYAAGVNPIKDRKYKFACVITPGIKTGDPINTKGDVMACPDGTNVSKEFRRLCGEKEPWSRGAGYVGNLILEQRKMYFNPEKKRNVKTGEGDMSIGHVAASVCNTAILLLLVCLIYFQNYQ